MSDGSDPRTWPPCCIEFCRNRSRDGGMCARCQTDVGVQRGETPAQATRVLSKNAARISGGFGSDELTQWLEDRKAVLHLSRQPGEDAQISIIRPKLPLCPGRVVTKRAKDVNDAVELAVAAWEAQPLK